MKAKINLHNRPNRPNGRIDTYQPYNKQQQRDQQQKDQQQAKNTVLVDRENRLNSAYSVNYNQACLLLQAVQMYGRRRLSSECLVQLAKFVAAAWETSPSQDKINALCQLMTNLLDTTLLCPEKPFDEALRQFCRNNIPTHSVSPSITLLIAIGYIERLKQKYTHIKGTTGCGHRLIMVAYMMAAKYMHVNLRFIVNTTASSSETSSTTITAPSSPTAATIPSTTTNLAHTSAERSTIRNNNNNAYTPSAKLPPILSNSKSEQLPSPPTSPKAYSDSDPLNYHYFQSRNNQMSITTTTPTPTTTSTINNDTLPPIHHIDRHFHILRMELEFLHFLNYDLSLSDTMRLIHWAQRFDDHNNNNLSSTGASSTVAESNGESHYSSGDEGGDEWDADGH